MSHPASRLLIGPYLNPTDAARIVWWNRLLACTLAGMLLGWFGVIGLLAAVKLGVWPL